MSFQWRIANSCHWLDFERRLEKSVNSFEYFVHRFSAFFDGINIDKLNEEFVDYQLLSSNDIPSSIKKSANLWGYLRGVKEPGTSQTKFGLLFRVAKVVMTIPHSNAGEERIFSLINKNKTPSRSSLKIGGTLSSLIFVKTHISDPLT